MHLTYRNRPKEIGADRPGVAEMLITPKMIEAGFSALEEGLGSLDHVSLAKDVYNAMWAASLIVTNRMAPHGGLRR